jgi:hypothetical protein
MSLHHLIVKLQTQRHARITASLGGLSLCWILSFTDSLVPKLKQPDYHTPINRGGQAFFDVENATL